MAGVYAVMVRSAYADPAENWRDYWADCARAEGREPTGEPALEWYDEHSLRVFTMRGPVS